MINLVPMAGEGSRFKTEGYADPKPLIQVSGKPMVLQASDSLPKPDSWIYICRSEHLQRYQIDRVLKAYAPDVSVLDVDHLTEGQACTCLLAKDLIDNDQELLIAASDSGMIWNQAKFEAAKGDADAVIWTFRGNVTVTAKPQAYGWVRTQGDKVSSVSVKVPISSDPIKDHAIVGTFWFRSGSIFVEAAERLIRENRRINNEFYVDEAMNDVLALGYKVKVFEVDSFVCWGTPNDLKTFEYWQEYFHSNPSYLYSREQELRYAR